MTATDRTALLAEAAEIQARRPDAVQPTRLTQARPLTPFAAQLHRLAAFITEHQLPEVEVLVIEGSVLLEAHDGLVENTVRQWAAALDLIVTAEPCDMHDGTAGISWTASGYDGRGTWWMVQGKNAVLAVAP